MFTSLIVPFLDWMLYDFLTWFEAYAYLLNICVALFVSWIIHICLLCESSLDLLTWNFHVYKTIQISSNFWPGSRQWQPQACLSCVF